MYLVGKEVDFMFCHFSLEGSSSEVPDITRGVPMEFTQVFILLQVQ
jgi:hypothetical protein